MQIEKLKHKHLPQIAEIEKQCFSHPWSLTSLQTELEKDDACFFAAVQNDVVLGYIGFNSIAGEGYIANVAVLPSYRKQGIGKQLIQAMVNAAREQGLAFLTLEVRKSNIAAIQLYEQFGFLPVGERKQYYSQPQENALLMTKYLKNKPE